MILSPPCQARWHRSVAVLGDRLQGARRHLDAHVPVELRNPDPLALEVGGKAPLHGLRHVTADPALFLGETAAVDFPTAGHP